MKVSIAAEAGHELLDGARYYVAQANEELGTAFISEFERSVEVLKVHPELGARWRNETRRMPLRRFPYSIIYRLTADEIQILAVAHQRRKPGYWSSQP